MQWSIIVICVSAVSTNASAFTLSFCKCSGTNSVCQVICLQSGFFLFKANSQNKYGKFQRKSKGIKWFINYIRFPWHISECQRRLLRHFLFLQLISFCDFRYIFSFRLHTFTTFGIPSILSTCTVCCYWHSENFNINNEDTYVYPNI